MEIKALLVCALVVISLGLFACTPEGAPIEISCDDFMNDNHISKNVEVTTGNLFTVTLCSNPATGFDWGEAEIGDQTVLEEESRDFVPPESWSNKYAIGIVGGTGKVVWTFRALEKGTTEVSINYRRPWERDEKGHWAFEMTVVVK